MRERAVGRVARSTRSRQVRTRKDAERGATAQGVTRRRRSRSAVSHRADPAPAVTIACPARRKGRDGKLGEGGSVVALTVARVREAFDGSDFQDLLDIDDDDR